MISIIQQGDQYYIPVTIKLEDEPVTPDNVDDVRIQIGRFMKSYSAESVSYDSENGVWLYPVTEMETRTMLGETSFQVGIKVSGEDSDEFIYSPVATVVVSKSIIKESWATT